ncbi:MAG: agmatine deiminase family protein [Candidatus Omnitrophica bacterium]|nr:agmatine deiminase family protein [Candidatus Omnitrophota bacterium]
MNKPVSAISKQKPAELGFHMPAEWERHAATWLAWPKNDITWPGEKMREAREAYLQMLEALLPHENVHLLVSHDKEAESILVQLKMRSTNTSKLIFHPLEYVDGWIRDYGPTFLKNKAGESAWCKWIFNAWGSKYDDLMQDTRVFEDMSLAGASPCFKADFVMEGGSIEVNGAGICLTSEQCLLNPNRNPHLSRQDIEKNLKDYLGVKQVLWLREGVVGDDTDGHIDDIARFTAEDTIVAAFEENPADENYAILKENWDRLQTFKDLKGRPFRLVQLPMPGRLEREGAPLPASYANFYLANNVVLLPVFDHKNDALAIKIMRELCPKREVIPIPSSALVYGFGAVHCLSQQEPL